MVWEAGQTVPPLKVNRGDAGEIHTPGCSRWSPELSLTLQEQVLQRPLCEALEEVCREAALGVGLMIETVRKQACLWSGVGGAGPLETWQ